MELAYLISLRICELLADFLICEWPTFVHGFMVCLCVCVCRGLHPTQATHMWEGDWDT